MLLKQKKYSLNLNNIVFNLSKACIIISKFNTKIQININEKFFININEKKVVILFLNKILFKNFITTFKNLYNPLNNLYFYKLKLKGLGFRLRKLTKNLIKCTFNLTNYIYIYIPLKILMLIKKRRLFFISAYWDCLRIFIVHVLLLNKSSIYKPQGFIYPKKIRFLKPGKKRF